MTGITATEARSNLYRLIDETAESHQPIVIMGKRNKAVLVSEEDWSAIQETLYLGLHQAGSERCKKVGLQRPQTKSPRTVSANSGRSLPQAASV